MRTQPMIFGAVTITVLAAALFLNMPARAGATHVQLHAIGSQDLRTFAHLDRLVGLAVDRLSVRQIVILGAGYDTRAARLPRGARNVRNIDDSGRRPARWKT